eukprot:447891-Alexandrium_andersonii.AAC.1
MSASLVGSEMCIRDRVNTQGPGSLRVASSSPARAARGPPRRRRCTAQRGDRRGRRPLGRGHLRTDGLARGRRRRALD